MEQQQEQWDGQLDQLLQDAELLFVDQDFPADSSVLTSDAPPGVVWRRPHELCDEPQLFVDGANRFDVVQGDLGNCWSMCACAGLAEHPDLVKKVVPDGQILHGAGYSGSIVIRLWHMNHWRDIEIDDRLPVFDDELIYARSAAKNEFWAPLLEKALAKFHGGYQNLMSGELTEGFINLTGYSVRSILLDDYKNGNNKNSIFKCLKNEIENRSLIICARIDSYARGLPGPHGYTVTSVRHVRSARQRLVRVRNPWGDDEWTGKWRDDHAIWKDLGADVLEELDYNALLDGEFWMKMVDFLKMFDEICIASRKPSVHEHKSLPATEEKLLREFWTKDTAGGPFECPTFINNHQFLLEVVEASEDSVLTPGEEAEEDIEDSDNENENKTEDSSTPEDKAANSSAPEDGFPVFIELLQDHNRRFGSTLWATYFRVYKVQAADALAAVDAGERLSLAQLLEGCSLAKTADSVEPKSSVYAYCHLLPGAQYVIVPHTKAPGELRRFLLRVYVRHAHVHLRLLGKSSGQELNGDGGDDEAELACSFTREPK